MPKQFTIDHKDINNKINEGHGQGVGSNYIPWTVTQNVSSEGRKHRILGWKTERGHHYLSDLERNFHYICDWSLVVVDIREQYPLLPIEETQSIAQQLGIVHPYDRKTGKLRVMTTDFLLDVTTTTSSAVYARTTKYVSHLETNKRTIEKFEIERLYWKARNIDWGIVTERDIPQILAKNIRFLHDHYSLKGRVSLPEDEISEVIVELTKLARERNASLSKVVTECDKHLNLRPGTSLSIAWHLIITRRWRVDLNKPLDTSKRLILLNDEEI